MFAAPVKLTLLFLLTAITPAHLARSSPVPARPNGNHSPFNDPHWQRLPKNVWSYEPPRGWVRRGFDKSGAPYEKVTGKHPGYGTVPPNIEDQKKISQWIYDECIKRFERGQYTESVSRTGKPYVQWKPQGGFWRRDDKLAISYEENCAKDAKELSDVTPAKRKYPPPPSARRRFHFFFAPDSSEPSTARDNLHSSFAENTRQRFVQLWNSASVRLPKAAAAATAGGRSPGVGGSMSGRIPAAALGAL